MNIVISGTNFWNPGDDFVRDGVIRVLRELFPGVALNFLGISVGRIFGGFLGGLLVATFPAAWALVVAGLLQLGPSIPIWRE